MKKFKDLIRKLYQWKIYTSLRFNWFYGEMSSYLNIAKDIGIVTLVFAHFKIDLNFFWTVSLCVLFLILGIIGGIILELTGMIRYGNELNAKFQPHADAYNKDSATAEMLRILKELRNK